MITGRRLQMGWLLLGIQRRITNLLDLASWTSVHPLTAPVFTVCITISIIRFLNLIHLVSRDSGKISEVRD